MIAAVTVWGASVAAGFTGFGFNLIAVPLLALVFLPKDAVIIALVLGLLVSAFAAIHAGARKEIDIRLLGLLTLGSIPGLILGTMLFGFIGSNVLQILIGVICVFSAILLLVRKRQAPRNPHPGESMGIGMAGGSLTATTGTGGPPVVAYLMVTGTDAAKLRGTILGYVALVSLLALVGHAVNGQITSSQLTETAKLIPAVLLGLVIGSTLFRRATPAAYEYVTRSALFIVGLAGIVVAFH